MAKLGSQGVNITKIYATSETVMGIEMAHSAKMGIFAGGRFRSILDVETSDLPLVQPYKRAFAAWRQEPGSPPELTVKLSTNGTDTSNQARTRTDKRTPPKSRAKRAC
jgi:hypothetical protein